MTAARMVLRRWQAENRAFWRSPANAVFTFAFPLLFMVVLNLVFSTRAGPDGATTAAFLTPAIIGFSVVNACFTSLAMSVTLAREEGVLKRIRGTPLPIWAYLGARMLQCVLVAAILVAIVAACGALLFAVAAPLDRLPELVAVLALGAATFCALGVAVSGWIRSAQAAPAVVNAIVLPLLVISDVFVRLDPASVLARVAGLFPVRHLSTALQTVYQPGVAVDPLDLAWLAAWGIAGALVAVRGFRWEPAT